MNVLLVPPDLFLDLSTDSFNGVSTLRYFDFFDCDLSIQLKNEEFGSFVLNLHLN
jgi:hypothetical protein